MSKRDRIKIFVDCHVFDGSFQGTTTYIKGLYSELIKDKNKQFFLAANDITILKKIFGEHENVVFIKYQCHNKFFRLLIDIPRIIKKNSIDFAHFQYIVPPIKYCKYIVTIHDVLFLDYPEYFPWSYKLKNKFLFQWSAKHSDIVLTVSEYSEKQLRKHFKIGDIIITPNAVDPVYFNSYDKSDIKKQVKEKYHLDKYWLYISRWEPRKNHHTLLEVFAENQYYKQFSLVFVGEMAIGNEKYNKYYDRLSDEIKAKVVTLNRIGFEELLLLLRGADLSVYPSIAEGFGIPPLEAAAARVPSLFSNTTAMGDFQFMKDMMFDPLDKRAITFKIEEAVNKGVHQDYTEQLNHQYNWTLSAQRLSDEITR